MLYRTDGQTRELWLQKTDDRYTDGAPSTRPTEYSPASCQKRALTAAGWVRIILYYTTLCWWKSDMTWNSSFTVRPEERLFPEAAGYLRGAPTMNSSTTFQGHIYINTFFLCTTGSKRPLFVPFLLYVTKPISYTYDGLLLDENSQSKSTHRCLFFLKLAEATHKRKEKLETDNSRIRDFLFHVQWWLVIWKTAVVCYRAECQHFLELLKTKQK